MKNTIRLKESQLKRVISESVKKVLSNIDMTEGKTVNNKHIFSKDVFNLAKPGENAWSIDNCEFFKTKGYKNFQDAKKAVESGELSKEIFDKWIDDLRKGLELHNTRTDKYDTSYYGGSIPSWGRTADFRRFDDRMRNIRYNHDMNKLTESQLKRVISESVKKVLKEDSESDRRYYEWIKDEKIKHQALAEYLNKKGIKSAHLSEYQSGLPVVALNTREFYDTDAHSIADEFIKSKKAYITYNDYPATTYLRINEI